MAFDWMNTETPGTNPEAQRDQCLRAVRERAKLLCNLNYSAGQATERIRADLNWEFDPSIASTPQPSFYKKLATVVSEIYDHKSSKSNAPKRSSKTKSKGSARKKKRAKK